MNARPPAPNLSLKKRTTLRRSHHQEAICALLFKVEAVVPYSRGDLLSRVHELGACDAEEYTDAGTLIQVTDFEECRKRLNSEKVRASTNQSAPCCWRCFACMMGNDVGFASCSGRVGPPRCQPDTAVVIVVVVCPRTTVLPLFRFHALDGFR